MNPISIPSPSSWLRRAAVVAATVTLAACGGGEETRTLSGVAATGAPIAGGTVDVACAGGADLQATTSNAGTWSVTLAGQSLPCKVRVSGGNLASGAAYHSFAFGVGTVNITPLTDLVVAQLAGAAPSAWFTQRSAADFQRLTVALATAAIDTVRTALAGVTGLSGWGSFNPVSGTFAAVASDPFDKLLEALKTAFPNYGALLAAAQAQGFSAGAVQTLLAGGGTGGGTAGGTGGGSSGGGTSGGGTSGGGATGPVLTCDLSNFPGVPAGAVRTATAQELALYVKTYPSGSLFDETKALSTTVSATFQADGQLILDGTSRTPTSVCYDTTVGSVDYGNTLYVHFSGGKADLWQKASTFAATYSIPKFATNTVSAVLASFNASGCASSGPQGAATRYSACTGSVLADFRLNGPDCIIWKSGSTLSLTNYNLVISAQLDSGEFDQAIDQSTSLELSAYDGAQGATTNVTITLQKSTTAGTKVNMNASKPNPAGGFTSITCAGF